MSRAASRARRNSGPASSRAPATYTIAPAALASQLTLQCLHAMLRALPRSPGGRCSCALHRRSSSGSESAGRPAGRLIWVATARMALLGCSAIGMSPPIDMIKTYTAANLQDAHIVLGLLRAEGIEARILNASAQGGLGEIPFTHAYPEIWLVNARDLGRAQRVVEVFEQPPGRGQPIRCAHCGEENPAGFEICWNCQSPIESN
jgi:hypothetical protein